MYKIKIIGKRHITFSEVAPIGKCFGCGGELTGRMTKFCSAKCKELWYIEHTWDWFRKKVTDERGNIREDCGASLKYRTDVPRRNWKPEVHRKKRIIDGGELCCRENVVVLCRACHKKRHTKTRS